MASDLYTVMTRDEAIQQFEHCVLPVIIEQETEWQGGTWQHVDEAHLARSRRGLLAVVKGRDGHAQLSLEAIIPNQVPARANLPQQLIAELKADSLPVSKTTLSSSVIMRESHEKAKPLVYLKPKHRLSLEFEALFQELESTR